MTKATVVTNHGAGEYTVKLEYDFGWAERRIDALTQEIIRYDDDILTAQLDYNNKQQALTPIVLDINAELTTAHAESRPPDADYITEKQSELAAASAERDISSIKLNRLKLSRASAATEKTSLQNSKNAKGSTRVRLWCADYTADLAVNDIVSVILVPGENGGTKLTMKPGYTDNAQWKHEVDGWLLPPWAMSAAALYLSAAFKPGWQRWKPTYRHGTLTSVNEGNDTCSVLLDAAYSQATYWDESSAQSKRFEVNRNNPTETLNNVPIVYMQCNAAVFDVNDRVIVELDEQDWGKPKVVGFIENPRQCNPVTDNITLWIASHEINKQTLNADGSDGTGNKAIYSVFGTQSISADTQLAVYYSVNDETPDWSDLTHVLNGGTISPSDSSLDWPRGYPSWPYVNQTTHVVQNQLRLTSYPNKEDSNPPSGDYFFGSSVLDPSSSENVNNSNTIDLINDIEIDFGDGLVRPVTLDYFAANQYPASLGSQPPDQQEPSGVPVQVTPFEMTPAPNTTRWIRVNVTEWEFV